MRKTLGTCLLFLLLTVPASAGIIQNETPAASQAKTISAVQEPTAEGEMQNDATDSLTQIALDVLALLPSLL